MTAQILGSKTKTTKSEKKQSKKKENSKTKAPQVETSAPKPYVVDRKMTVLGYVDGPHGDKTFVIPEADRQNIAVFGEIGSGKTTVLRMLIMQDIMRGTGFMLIDPHREFSREVLSMIPKDQQDRVVYISLASLYQFGRTVCINPLQTKTEHEKYIRTAGCIDNLKQYFSDGWGHRLETVLRNMINLVMSTPETFKFLDIMAVLFDENQRNYALRKCTKQQVRDFWTNVFPKFAPEAAGAIYNKFDKIINTPPIAAMFSSAESTISIREIIEDGKIVIVDLGSAATIDIIEFMGTLLINMFNLENKIRFDLGDSVKTPYNLYIDEVHMFSPSVIRELLNNVRKYNMKVTVATQSIKVLDDDLAKEIDDLFRCLVMFRCDFDTARLLARNMPVEEADLAQLGFHRFAAFSQGFDRVSGIGKTRHIEIPSRWKDVAQKSLEKYGKEIPLESYSFASKKGSSMPIISPLEYFLLNTMYLQQRDINYGELVAAGKAKFDVDDRAVRSALVDSLTNHYHYTAKSVDYHDGQNQYATHENYAIAPLALDTVYSRAYAGPGAGGALHISVISSIADWHTRQFHYCIPDLADTGGPRADLLIYQFMGSDESTATPNGKLNDNMWSEKILAIEVETDPTKHKGQIIINYEKNVVRGFRVCFVVFSKKHKEYVMNALAEKDIGRELYDLRVVEPEKIDTSNKPIYSASESAVSEDKEAVVRAFGSGYESLAAIIDKAHLSPSAVMSALESMEKDGDIERSGVEKRKTIQTTDLKGERKSTKHYDTFTLSQKLKQKAVIPTSEDTAEETAKYAARDTAKGTDHVTDKVPTEETAKETTKTKDEEESLKTDPDKKYTEAETATLKMLLEDPDAEGHDAMIEALKLRDLGVRRAKNGSIILFSIKKDIHGYNNMEGKNK